MNFEFRQILIALDANAARRAWSVIAPHLPQPKTDAEALVTLHLARTAAQTVPPRHRYYSHRWLTDNEYPSGLPDRLRAPAERMYPKKIDAVGFSVLTGEPEVKGAVIGAVANAIEDCYANGDRDPLIVKPQMMAARARERRGLMLPGEVT